MNKTLALIIITLVTSCKHNNEVVVNPIIENEKPTETIESFVCVDENEEQLSCKYDQDCCDGFVCVIDRAKGINKRFCEYEQ